MTTGTTTVVDQDPTNKVNVDLIEDGLLWLINTTVFHPRGFALGYTPETGEFELWGNGDEPWEFGGFDLNAKFNAAEAAFAKVRKSE